MAPSGQSSSDTTLLAFNSGSSSLKLGLYRAVGDDVALLATGSAEGIGRTTGSLRLLSPQGEVLLKKDHLCETQDEALGKLVEALRAHFPQPPTAIGHRIVHGGPHLREPAWLSPAVRQQLQEATQFAPLHIPLALALVRQVDRLFPGVPQAACFDTAFHRTLPRAAAQFPLPVELYRKGVLRYGFHGLSYESIVTRLGTALPSRAVFAHLGNGSSLAAVRDGQSIDTTMGLTPTGGIPMSTRSGDLDPGVLLALLRHEGATADSLESLLNHEAGLKALSGGESDMQALLQRNDAEAALAVTVFCNAVTKSIGAYAALLGGVDLLVFTGGIGEHSAEIRQRICAPLAFLGLGDGKQDGTKLRVLRAEEEAQIARHCRALLQTQSSR